jgi:flagellar protein FlaI
MEGFETSLPQRQSGAFLQGSMNLLLASLFFIKFNLIFLVFLAIILYWIFGMMPGPAWSSWMGDLVEADRKGRYFGKRNMITGITLFDLLKAAVRQRPDYIIVGEVRGEEAYTLFQAMATGHLGMCTLHGESVESALRRLEAEPMNIPRSLLPMIDIILVQGRTEIAGKPARRAFSATEMVGLDPRTKELLTNDVYRWQANTDTFHYLGRSYMLERMMKKLNLSAQDLQNELLMRKTVLEWMVKNNIRRYSDVANAIREYYADPMRVYHKAKVGV